jgi:hypothetical protein
MNPEYNLGEGAAYVAFVAPSRTACSSGHKHSVLLGYLFMADDAPTMRHALIWARQKDPTCVIIWIRWQPEPPQEVLQ